MPHPIISTLKNYIVKKKVVRVPSYTQELEPTYIYRFEKYQLQTFVISLTLVRGPLFMNIHIFSTQWGGRNGPISPSYYFWNQRLRSLLSMPTPFMPVYYDWFSTKYSSIKWHYKITFNIRFRRYNDL